MTEVENNREPMLEGDEETRAAREHAGEAFPSFLRADAAAELEARELARKFEQLWQREVRDDPCDVNRASALSHPCNLALYFARTAWQQAALRDWRTQVMFSQGHLQERDVLTTLLQLGCTPMDQQRTFFDEDHLIRGHPDGSLVMGGRVGIVEIKGLSPHNWHALSCWRDFKRHRRYWARGWAGQMTLYTHLAALAWGKPWEEVPGLWVLKCKVTGLLKFVPATHDDQLRQELLARAVLLNHAVETRTPPEPNPDTTICPSCAHALICPAVRPLGEGIQVVDDELLLSMVDTWWDTRDAHHAHEEANDGINDMVRDRPSILLGGQYHITGELSEFTKGAQPAREIRVWRKKIIKLGGEREDDGEGAG